MFIRESKRYPKSPKISEDIQPYPNISASGTCPVGLSNAYPTDRGYPPPPPVELIILTNRQPPDTSP